MFVFFLDPTSSTPRVESFTPNMTYVVRPLEDVSGTVFRVADMLAKDDVTLEAGEAMEALLTLVEDLETRKLATVSGLETVQGAKGKYPTLKVCVKQAGGFQATYDALVASDWETTDKLNKKQEVGTDKHGDLYLNKRLGRILKPAVDDTKMAREVAAFGALAKHKRLSRFLPRFYGARTFQGRPHIELENLLRGLSGDVASLDIKMGLKTYDDDAKPEKQAKEAAKVVAGKCSSLGYRLVGMKAGAHELSHPAIRERNDLTVEEFQKDGMTPFLWKRADSTEVDVRCLVEVTRYCELLLKILKQGYGGVLRAASLFIAREMKPKGKLVFKVCFV